MQSIQGDFLRLQNADGITEDELELLKLYQKSTKSLAGAQAMRRTFIPKVLGFRTVYGDVHFFTITPDRRHSALLWRLMRGRINDTFLAEYDGVEMSSARKWRRRYADANTPSLYSTIDFMDVDEEVNFETYCPTVQDAVAMSANDPLATILHYNVCIKGTSTVGMDEK